jgi:hypothetical protein
MKARRLLFLAGTAVVVVLALALALSAYSERKQPLFTNAPELIAGLRAFSHDRVTRGVSMPREVSLQDLVAGGYLTTNDVVAFDGIDVIFFTGTSETTPQAILAVARPLTEDKQITCLFADGSVAGFSRSGYEEMLRNSGRQPFSPQGNPDSPAAASRRSP